MKVVVKQMDGLGKYVRKEMVYMANESDTVLIMKELEWSAE